MTFLFVSVVADAECRDSRPPDGAAADPDTRFGVSAADTRFGVSAADTRFGVSAADTKNMSEESRQILHDLQLELNHSKRFHSVPAGAHNSQPFCECLHKVDESLSFWLLKYCLKSPF